MAKLLAHQRPRRAGAGLRLAGLLSTGAAPLAVAGRFGGGGAQPWAWAFSLAALSPRGLASLRVRAG